MEYESSVGIAGEIVQDDAAQAAPGLQEITGGTEPESIETLGKPDAQASPDAAQSEPSWMKKRIQSAVDKEIARVRSEYEAQLRPLRDAELHRRAEALVSEHKFGDIALAEEYLRLKEGLPVQQTVQTEQPARDAQGRFTARDAEHPDDAAVRARELMAQAKAIRGLGGPDVLGAYNNDESVKRRVLSGEWDFEDVARAMSAESRMPSPMRSAAGSAAKSTIANMTPEQFRRLNDDLDAGKRYTG